MVIAILFGLCSVLFILLPFPSQGLTVGGLLSNHTQPQHTTGQQQNIAIFLFFLCLFLSRPQSSPSAAVFQQEGECEYEPLEYDEKEKTRYNVVGSNRRVGSLVNQHSFIYLGVSICEERGEEKTISIGGNYESFVLSGRHIYKHKHARTHGKEKQLSFCHLL